MNVKRILFICLMAMTVLQEVFAGPGGQIAKHVFTSPFGKFILILLTIVLLPFIIYNNTKEFFRIKKTKSDLEKLSRLNSNFNLFTLKNRATEVFNRVHSAWAKENMEEASSWMTHWYWQNQQLAFLDRWKNNDLVNHTDVRMINSIKPIHIDIINSELNFDGSRIVLSIDANMEDYLAKRSNGQVVEGKRGYYNTETIWTLILQNNSWYLDHIEEYEHLSEYLKMKNSIPWEDLKKFAPIVQK